MFDFTREADRHNCDVQGTGATRVLRSLESLRTAGDFQGFACRPLINLFIFYPLKRLYYEMLHAEKELGKRYDAIMHSRADIFRIYPVPSVRARFEESYRKDAAQNCVEHCDGMNLWLNTQK